MAAWSKPLSESLLSCHVDEMTSSHFKVNLHISTYCSIHLAALCLHKQQIILISLHAHTVLSLLLLSDTFHWIFTQLHFAGLSSKTFVCLQGYKTHVCPHREECMSSSSLTTMQLVGCVYSSWLFLRPFALLGFMVSVLPRLFRDAWRGYLKDKGSSLTRPYSFSSTAP